MIELTKVVDGERVGLDNTEKAELEQRRNESSAGLIEVQANKIDSIKEQANKVLSETDWYIIRKQETGESIPQSVIDHRLEVRSLSDQFESDVNNLNSVSEVQDYSFEFPEPPEL